MRTESDAYRRKRGRERRSPGVPRGRESVSSAASATFSAGWPPFGRGYLFLSWLRGRPGFSPAPRSCGPTTNPRALGHQERCFLHSTSSKEGWDALQLPGSFRSRLLGSQTWKLSLTPPYPRGLGTQAP